MTDFPVKFSLRRSPPSGTDLLHKRQAYRTAIRARITEAPTLTDAGILGKVAVDERWLHRDVLLNACSPHATGAIAVVVTSTAASRPGTPCTVGAEAGWIAVRCHDPDCSEADDW